MESGRFRKIAERLLWLLGLFLVISASVKVSAEDSVQVLEINHEKSYIKVKMGASDSLLQISDAKQKKWETVTEEVAGGSEVIFDISWISVSKDYVLSLRGDASQTPVKVTIPLQNKKFKVTYSPADGLTFTNAGDGAAIQWKKKESLIWKSFPSDKDKFNQKLAGMIAKGATLMFRTAPQNGDATNPGARASKEVSVTIKPRTAAPAMKVDDVKMTVSVKKDMEYRYCDENGNPKAGANWITVDKTEDVDLSTIASDAMSNGTTDGTDVYIQFRNKATAKTQISNITTIKIPGQKAMLQAVKDEIKLNFISPSSATLSVGAATDKTPYEYCIISYQDLADGVTIDSKNQLSWITIPDSKPVSIAKSKSGDGSKIYVRKKAIGKLGDENYELASTYYEFASIRFPKELSTLSVGAVWHTVISGTCRPGNTGQYISFTSYSAVDAPITEIKFVKGTAPSSVQEKVITASDTTFKSEVRPLEASELSSLTEEQKKDYKYLVTTTIMNLDGVDELVTSETFREWYLYYKQGTGSSEYVESSTEKGIGLYIFPSSAIVSPTSTEITSYESKKSSSADKVIGDHADYMTEFSRLYGSTRIYTAYSSDWNLCDANAFNFVVRLGTAKEPKSDSRGELTSNKRTVTKIVYDGITFNKGDKNSDQKPYFICTDSDDGSIIVTVDASAMEKTGQIKSDNIYKSLDIYLGGGEVIKNEVKIKFVKSAVVVSDKTSTSASQQSWSITGLLETETVTTTTVNGVPTVTRTPKDVDKIIWLKIADDSLDLEIDSVEFDNVPISKSYSRDGGYFRVEISNSLFNKIISTITTKTSKELVFTFSNGFVLSEGYKITVNPVSNP